ncbi:ATP-dependent DNA helicase [Haloarchaeobius sp. TZWSO28]|uniref:ATP-dependent DNA helicase n=1 Tax=Haloarchaeobius sp. TZWSO28 TaxID=3446119 RepID=UPI003EBFDAAB
MSEVNAYLRFFPYDEPYDNQGEAMDRIHTSLERGQDVLFEGACGTGKTLSALVPALEYARETEKTVVITTDVHQQMRQFVQEARAITKHEPIRAVVFKGKASMCHIDVGYEECQVLRDNTRELVDARMEAAQLRDRERELLSAAQEGEEKAAEARKAVVDELDAVSQRAESISEEKNVCDHYRNNLTGNTEEFYQWLFDDVRTPDDVYEYAHQQTMCGYELLKDGMEGVDLVVANYHHLLDPMIREQFFRWLGRDPEDVITVFDEAHNVEGAARDHATRTLTEQTLDQALEELDESEDSRATRAETVLRAYRDALVEVYEESFSFGEREQVGDDWEDVAVANESGRDDLTMEFLQQQYDGLDYKADLEAAVMLGKELDDRYEEAYKNGEATTRQECQTLQAATFVGAWMREGTQEGLHPVASVRRDQGTDEVYGRAELYTCIPQEVTKELFEEVHATVLMSATLRPFHVTEDVLGLTNPVNMAYGLQFPPEKRRTYAVSTPALFASARDDPTVQKEVGDTLHDVVRFTPGNTLVFTPNYSEAARYAAHLRKHGDATVYLDKAGVSAEDLREDFTNDDDAVLLTSLWGTLAEGVSFDGDDARTVAVLGVPYPHLDDRAEAVQQAYGKAFGRPTDKDPGWKYAVEIPTVRKTRQALGRVIRSPDDFGVRVLLDERYTAKSKGEMGKYSVRDTFPAEERDEMLDIKPEKLKFAMMNFYQDMEAYDGPPPQP